MKVNVSQLKTHLSAYLKELREGGEPVEVCIREEPVAYLTAACAGTHMGDGEADRLRLQARLKSAGLTWTGLSAPAPGQGFLIEPQRAGDGREDLVTVETLRRETDW